MRGFRPTDNGLRMKYLLAKFSYLALALAARFFFFCFDCFSRSQRLFVQKFQ